MEISVYEDKRKASRAAAKNAGNLLRENIRKKGSAVFVAATGTSQFDFLEFLIKEDDIDWSKTTMFHLDEYVGIPETHPASFSRYLKERLISKVELDTVHLIHGEKDNPQKECERLNSIVRNLSIDVAFLGIGENGHIAFNDPPADFKTEKPFIVVELDKKCREQQVGEGWFESVNDVPKEAITMSVKQIMKSDSIICTVPEKRKAEAARKCFEGDVSPDCPASILQTHENSHIYLDERSASLMEDYTVQ